MSRINMRAWTIARIAGLEQGKLRSKDKETGQLVITDAHIAAAMEAAIQSLSQKKMQGEFIPRREVDELSVALGNKEHPGRVRGSSSKFGFKHGFPQELGLPMLCLMDYYVLDDL